MPSELELALTTEVRPMFSPHMLQIRRRPLRAVVAFLLVVAVVLATPNMASAHTDLAGSTPQNGETTQVVVSEIELVFVNPIDFDKSSFEVVDSVGSSVPIEMTSIGADDAAVTILLSGPVYQGAIGVGYTIVANDSHPRSGSITFVVDAPLPTPAPTAEPSGELPAPEPSIESVTTQPTVVAAPELAEATASSTPESLEEEAPSAASEETVSAETTVVGAPGADDDAGPASVPDLSEFLAPSATLGQMVNAQTAVRGVGYAAGVALIGGLLFFAQIAGAQPAGVRRRVLQASALVTAVSGVALVALKAGITNGGSFRAFMNPIDWAGELGGSFGIGVLLRVVGGLGGLTMAGAVSQLPLFGALVTALSFPFLGHGVSRDPWWLVFPTDLVHVVVVSIWTGGLLMLVLGLRGQDTVLSREMTSTQTVERYSTVAGWAVAAAAVTGVVLAATELQTFGEFFSTTYGKRLVLKTVLVAGIVGLGAVHRFRLIPALRHSGEDSTPLRKMVTTGSAEVIVMVAVLVVTTLLVNAAT